MSVPPTSQTSEVCPLNQQLQPFLNANALAACNDNQEPAVITRPWGDDSLVIKVRKDSTELIECLNRIYLPPRLSAIYHLEKREIEFFYGYAPIDSPLCSRKFSFRYGGRTYECGFRPPSDELWAIAEAAQPNGSSRTDYRNLREFVFERLAARTMGRQRRRELVETTPLCFWIDDIDWEENSVLNLALHLSFYMRYYDPLSPVVAIHDEEPKRSAGTINMPLFDTFPEIISGRQLDPFLLKLWESTLGTDAFRRFLHNYQILEYASFYFLRDDALNKIKRVLTAPETAARANDAAKAILEVAVDTQMTDEHKLVHVVQRLVSPDHVWNVISANMEFFASPIEFEGGMKIEPFVRSNWTLEDFKASWIPAFPDRLRTIRNGMVHARERRMAKVILPTAVNQDMIRPWLAPLQTTAMEVMIYWDAAFS